MNRTAGSGQGSKRRKRIRPRDVVRFALWATGIALLIFAAVTVFSEPLREWSRDILDWIRDLGPWGMIAFVGIYAVLSLLGVPITPLDIAAGLIFHLTMGFAVSIAGSAAGATIGFFIARYLLHDWVASRLNSYETSRALMEAVEEEGFKIILLTRLNPVIPASLKNYLFGVTNVSFSRYIAASLLGVAAPVFIHVYLGAVGHVTMVSSREELGTGKIVALALGLIVSLALGGVLFYYGRKKLKEQQAPRSAAAGA